MGHEVGCGNHAFTTNFFSSSKTRVLFSSHPLHISSRAHASVSALVRVCGVCLHEYEWHVSVVTFRRTVCVASCCRHVTATLLSKLCEGRKHELWGAEWRRSCRRTRTGPTCGTERAPSWTTPASPPLSGLTESQSTSALYAPPPPAHSHLNSPTATTPSPSTAPCSVPATPLETLWASSPGFALGTHYCNGEGLRPRPGLLGGWDKFPAFSPHFPRPVPELSCVLWPPGRGSTIRLM